MSARKNLSMNVNDSDSDWEYGSPPASDDSYEEEPLETTDEDDIFEQPKEVIRKTKKTTNEVAAQFEDDEDEDDEEDELEDDEVDEVVVVEPKNENLVHAAAQREEAEDEDDEDEDDEDEDDEMEEVVVVESAKKTKRGRVDGDGAPPDQQLVQPSIREFFDKKREKKKRKVTPAATKKRKATPTPAGKTVAATRDPGPDRDRHKVSKTSHAQDILTARLDELRKARKVCRAASITAAEQAAQAAARAAVAEVESQLQDVVEAAQRTIQELEDTRIRMPLEECGAAAASIKLVRLLHDDLFVRDEDGQLRVRPLVRPHIGVSPAGTLHFYFNAEDNTESPVRDKVVGDVLRRQVEARANSVDEAFLKECADWLASSEERADTSLPLGVLTYAFPNSAGYRNQVVLSGATLLSFLVFGHPELRGDVETEEEMARATRWEAAASVLPGAANAARILGRVVGEVVGVQGQHAFRLQFMIHTADSPGDGASSSSRGKGLFGGGTDAAARAQALHRDRGREGGVDTYRGLMVGSLDGKLHTQTRGVMRPALDGIDKVIVTDTMPARGETTTCMESTVWSPVAAGRVPVGVSDGQEYHFFHDVVELEVCQKGGIRLAVVIDREHSFPRATVERLQERLRQAFGYGSVEELRQDVDRLDAVMENFRTCEHGVKTTRQVVREQRGVGARSSHSDHKAPHQWVSCVVGACPYAAQSIHRLKRHVEHEHPEALDTPESCQWCGKEVKWFKLHYHLLACPTNPGNQRVQCSLCGSEMAKRSLWQHDAYHCPERPNYHLKKDCEYCGTALGLSSGSQRGHALYHCPRHPAFCGGETECDVCHKTLDLDSLGEHRKYHCREHPKFIGEMVTCESCNVRIANSSLYVHRRFFCLSSPDRDPDARSPCQYCLQMVHKPGLPSHLRSYCTGNGNPHRLDGTLTAVACDNCGQLFRSTSQLEVHLRGTSACPRHPAREHCEHCDTPVRPHLMHKHVRGCKGLTVEQRGHRQLFQRCRHCHVAFLAGEGKQMRFAKYKLKDHSKSCDANPHNEKIRCAFCRRKFLPDKLSKHHSSCWARAEKVVMDKLAAKGVADSSDDDF